MVSVLSLLARGRPHRAGAHPPPGALPTWSVRGSRVLTPAHPVLLGAGLALEQERAREATPPWARVISTLPQDVFSAYEAEPGQKPL